MTPSPEVVLEAYVWPAIAMIGGLVTWLVGSLAWLFTLSGRVSVLEKRYEDLQSWLLRVEGKLDRALERDNCALNR